MVQEMDQWFMREWTSGSGDGPVVQEGMGKWFRRGWTSGLGGDGPVVQEEMKIKVISYLQLWPPYCSAEWSHLCNFGRGHYEEHFCEIFSPPGARLSGDL